MHICYISMYNMYICKVCTMHNYTLDYLSFPPTTTKTSHTYGYANKPTNMQVSYSDQLKFSLVPRLSCGGGKRAWYTLFAHASSSLGNLHTTPLH